jgi:mRNA interferase YafQ
MRRIERTNAFRRDFKRELRGQHRREVESLLTSIFTLLANDQPLPERNRDHALTGDWHDFRDCHLKPDLVLIYRKAEPNVLQLVRMGSHSELFE